MYRHPYMDKFYITQEAYEAISLFVSPSEAIQKAKDTTSFVTYMAQKQKITHDKPYTSEKVDAAHDNTNTPPVQNIAPNKTQAIVSATSTLSQSSPPVHSQPTTSPITNTTTRATTTTTNTKVVANTKPAQPEFSLDALLMSISDRPTDPPVIPMIPAIPVPLESSLHVPSKRKTRSYKNKRQKKGTGDDPFHENEDTGSFMEISHVEHIPSDLEIAALAAGVDPT
ncbi:hypothetical protein BDF14DRAFT_1831420 [Spinellus fusiger]|nr:hypothetical protein BDF14DRAFT_1831420 [Spinellus fusiger]